ncbi:long-chain fatty acid--CoA ligase [Streptomyces sp. NPDC001914]|uniref:long-chain-fatty-acid--CoA ligase n=1 Tax=Streptomyces sp. NPDC001914 TaxID=3364623 RepID=UPI00368F77CC
MTSTVPASTDSRSGNLARILTERPRAWDDRPAVLLEDDVLSYAELDTAAARAAAWLRDLGVRPGDRVALMLPNTLEFPVLYHGILRAGAVVVPMNPLLREREITYYLSDSGAAVAFVCESAAPEARTAAATAGSTVVIVDSAHFAAALAEHPPEPAVVPREGGDTAVILYTSGTTGQPKGAELTHANLARNTGESAELFGLRAGDVVFGGLPLFHTFGQTCSMNGALASGAALALLPRFTPAAALDLLRERRVTHMVGVPTMYTALLNHSDHGADLDALRMCVSGGASLPVEVLHGFEQAFGCVVVEGYGLTETSPVAAFNHPDRPRKPGSVGTPINGVELRLVDDTMADVTEGTVGEIVVRGHNVMKGYWHRPEATAEAVVDGWFRTGDLARRDDDGYYFIVDRRKDLIIRGGYNVYPREVEEVLYEHPAVAEAAVVGVPHALHGEEVAAAVALKPGATATADELREHVRSRVAPYKYPRTIWLVDALPKGPTGKILKREIKPPSDR